jgi:hypothetical protein
VTENRETPQWVEREVAHSRDVIANAKLVATFSAALAATFVAAFIDKGHQNGVWDEVTLVLMGLTLCYTVRVILLRHGAHEGEMDREVFEDAKRIADKAHRLVVRQVVSALLSIIAVVCQMRF